MKRATCGECGQAWPARLVHVMASSDPAVHGKALDPICALRLRNALHGLPPGTPFGGEMAAQLHAEALRWARAHGLKVQP